MTCSIFIDGAAGTTGLEIRERLADRTEFSLLTLNDKQRKDAQARKEALNACDIAILCLPDDAAREAVAMVENPKTRIIDASTAHRISDGWTYGFPEIVGRDHIKNANRIANPGCYPTGFLGLVAPLVRAGHLPAEYPFTVNAISGYSGGGKGLIERFQDDAAIAWRGYGFDLNHKHLPEMRHYAGLKYNPIFSPSVVRAHRGMIVDIPLPLGAMGTKATPAQLRDTLVEYYTGSPFITVRADTSPPAEITVIEGSQPWDGMELAVYGSDDADQARLIARLDNLGKGASGAVVQTLNLLSGLPEQTGLNTRI